jgi:predicted DNA-binding transcriptional regulator AlpA
MATGQPDSQSAWLIQKRKLDKLIDGADDVLLSTREFCVLLRCHKSTIQRRRKRDKIFPKPVEHNSQFHQWRLADAMAYLASKQDQSA